VELTAFLAAALLGLRFLLAPDGQPMSGDGNVDVLLINARQFGSDVPP
jgi:hypothetical protein